MTDLTPIIRETADEDELWILRAARAEQPRSGVKGDLVAWLLQDGEAACGREPAGEGDSSTLPVTGRRPRESKSTSWLGSTMALLRESLTPRVAKPALAWLVLGMAVGGAGGSFITARLSGPGRPVFVPVQGEPLQPPAAAAPAPSACPPAAPARVEETSSREENEPTRHHRSAREGKAAASVPNIADEVSLLDDARRALADGEAARALSALDAHAQRFTTGVLTQEADVLRIRALLEAGARAEAKARADDYLSKHADSPHANQVRVLVDMAERDAANAKSDKAPAGPTTDAPGKR
jgi:hypothetical protein